MRNSEMASMTLFALFLFTFMFVLKSFAASDFKMIDTAQLHSMIVDNAYRIEGGRQKQFTVIDARTREEYNEAHIFSAISIPEKDVENFMTLLPKDKSVQLVVYCSDIKSGTSTKWASKASAYGYTNIIIYSEGFSAWKALHMPTAPLDGIQSTPSDPFINMLKAVETSDIEKFKASYAKHIREDENQNDWEKNISEARTNIERIFGDVKYDDFTFKFDEDKSSLGIIHKGKLVFWIAISKEDGLWKLNER